MSVDTRLLSDSYSSVDTSLCKRQVKYDFNLYAKPTNSGLFNEWIVWIMVISVVLIVLHLFGDKQGPVKHLKLNNSQQHDKRSEWNPVFCLAISLAENDPIA